MSKDITKCSNEAARRASKIFLLFIIGFLIVFVGIAILLFALVFSGGSVDVGGVIFIWFIPIVFGVGPHAFLMILFATILAVLSIIMFLILRRGAEKST